MSSKLHPSNILMKAKLIYCDILLSQTELIKKKLMYGRVRDKEIKMIKKK